MDLRSPTYRFPGGYALSAASLPHLMLRMRDYIVNANSAKSTTGSTITPTVTTSVKTVVINDDEEVQVSDLAHESFWTEDPVAVNESAFKCPGCRLVTVHQGYVFTICSNIPQNLPTEKRVYLCSHCGRMGTK